MHTHIYTGTLLFSHYCFIHLFSSTLIKDDKYLVFL